MVVGFLIRNENAAKNIAATKRSAYQQLLLLGNLFSRSIRTRRKIHYHHHLITESPDQLFPNVSLTLWSVVGFFVLKATRDSYESFPLTIPAYMACVPDCHLVDGCSRFRRANFRRKCRHKLHQLFVK